MTNEKKYKKTGKKAEPSVEELQFIHGRLEKLSDREILEEMEEETEFPRRSLGFMKRRRREFNVAKKVLKEHMEGKVDPVFAERRKEHWDKLADAAQKLHNTLSMPNFRTVCQGNVLPGTALLVDRDGRGWIYDWDKQSNEPVISLAVGNVSPLLFGSLLLHLEAEFPQFDLKGWRRQAGKLIHEWNKLAAEIREMYTERTGITVSKGRETGLTPLLAPFHCDWLVNNFGSTGKYMELDASLTGSQPPLVLHPKGLPAYQLAYGDAKQIEQFREASHLITDLYVEDPRIGGLANQVKQVDETASKLRNILSLVVERRSFQGTCDICQSWTR